MPPSSTSARIATESVPWSSGYRNSISEIGDTVAVAVGEVVALEHPGDRHLRGEAQDVLHVERGEPLGVAAHLEPALGHVEDVADLFEVGLRVRVDLLLRQPGPGRRAPRRVTDLGGEVAEDQHRDVAEVLEQPQPAQHDREAEVDVGGGRVDAQLHPQRAPRLELRPQLRLGDDVDRARGQQLHLAIDVHGSFVGAAFGDAVAPVHDERR